MRPGAASWRGLPAAVALLLALAPAVHAAVFAPQGDATRGKSLAATCAGCHGPQGRAGVAGFPHLAGQSYHYLIEQLRSMRAAARERAGHETPEERARQRREQRFPRIAQRYRSNPVMDGYVLGLGDGDIRDLAAYYATLSCGGTPAAVTPPRPAVAERCAVCHGDGGVSDNSAIPTLAGQDATYLENEIKVLRANGQARGPAGEKRQVGMMSRQAAGLDDRQISALAAYFSALPCSRPQ